MSLNLVLKEWKQTELPGELFAPFADEIHDLYGDYIDIGPPCFGRKTWILKPRGYVGYLPFQGGVIEIQPKVSVNNLFGMLEVAYNLESLKVLSGLTESSSLADFYSRLAAILANRVLQRCRKGLYRTYLSESASLAFIRGKIDISEAARKPWDPLLRCTYEDHTTDVDENRIILWTLSAVLRSGICSKRYLPQIRQAYRVLGRFAEHAPYHHTDCTGRLYNRLNDDYEPMHGLCRFFLERTGPCQGGSSRRMLPFILNMHKLFEEFAAKWLTRRMKKDGRFTLRAGKRLDAGAFPVIPDLIIEDSVTGDTIIVADTKYKDSKQVESDDVYQVFSYARKLRCSRAVLIYPFLMEMPYTHNWDGETLVQCLPFDLARPIEEGGEELFSNLVNIYERQLKSGLDSQHICSGCSYIP